MIQALGATPAQSVKAKADGEATGFSQLLTNVKQAIETKQPDQSTKESELSEKQMKEEPTLPFIPLMALVNMTTEQSSEPQPSSQNTNEASDELSAFLSQGSADKGKTSEIKLPGFIKSELLKVDPEAELLVKLVETKTVSTEEVKAVIAKVIVENNETLTKKEQSDLLATLKRLDVDGVTRMKDSLTSLIQKTEETTEVKQPAESTEMDAAENLESAKTQVDEQPESLPHMKTSEAPSQSLVKETNTPIPVRQLNTSLSDMITERMQVMKNGDESHIRIKLSPENLGQLDIRLTTLDGKVTAFIATATSAAKEMIESQLHQLRQTLIQQGVQLDKVEVIQQPSSPSQSSMLQDGRSQQGQQFEQGKRGSERNGNYEVDENPLITQETEERVDGGINYAV
ncbi:flagellar hook-length control protein FliK [Bacillus sp. NTK071]|uniref:flagellar hook-length control protein FliK n=1 Tax=Bacillus sp. NTK071 TaxID=2802175 RepID=UPI0025708C34|nr:flagellar hook-length control protein FliK [Bacillus sp. NTK071]